MHFLITAGLLGGDLPILVLDFPVTQERADGQAKLRKHEESIVAEKMKRALAEHRYSDVPALAIQMDTFSTHAPPSPSPPPPAPDPTDTVLWEMMVVPVANNTGREQPTYFRFMQVNSTAAKNKGTCMQ